MEGEQADPVLRKTTTKYKVINNLQITGMIIQVFSDVFFEPISGKEFLSDRPVDWVDRVCHIAVSTWNPPLTLANMQE